MDNDDVADNAQREEKDKRVKIQVEGEDETGEGETGRKKMKRFQLPNLPRWWQAKIIQYAFTHPHVRARLEKHMGSNLVRLTDKTFMTELEERIRAVNEENLNKRISSRVLDEMERLKRLILVGKTPLKECPPELFNHPVFVFWRMVNKEVARATKKRADAYYRKLKASQNFDQTPDEEAESEALQEETEQLTPEQLLRKCTEEIEELKNAEIEKGFRFTDEQFAVLKYETNDVKTLKNLTYSLPWLTFENTVSTILEEGHVKSMRIPRRACMKRLMTVDEAKETVEELYALADKIIGTKRL